MSVVMKDILNKPKAKKLSQSLCTLTESVRCLSLNLKFKTKQSRALLGCMWNCFRCISLSSICVKPNLSSCEEAVVGICTIILKSWPYFNFTIVPKQMVKVGISFTESERFDSIITVFPSQKLFIWLLTQKKEVASNATKARHWVILMESRILSILEYSIHFINLLESTGGNHQH